MVVRGEWRNVSPWNTTTAYQGTPSSKSPETNEGNYSKREGSVMEGYHGNSYKVLAWDQMRYMAPGLSMQDGDWDLERFIDTFADKKGKELPYRLQASWIRNFPGRGYRFNGGDGSNPSNYKYAGDYGTSPAGQDPSDHYIKNGRFHWPYARSGKVNIKATWGVDKRGSGDRGYGMYLRVYDSEGKRIKSVHRGSRIHGAFTDYRDIKLNDWTMNSGDYICMEIKQDSSKRKIDLEKQSLEIDIFLTDLHDTVELEREILVAKPAYDNPPGMVTALGTVTNNAYKAYIRDGSYYNQPHLEKYNELFSAKTPSSPQKKT